MSDLPGGLKARLTDGAKIEPASPGGWRLEIPPGPGGQYRLAQLDDYEELGRGSFPHAVPLRIKLEGCASAAALPGTWGFGVWNDPFGMGVKFGKGARLPALPNAAWYFFASKENYLSLVDELPANGALAGTFRSRRWPAWLLALGAPGLVLMAFPWGRRLLRKLARLVVAQDAAALSINPTEWHTYQLDWTSTGVDFLVDGECVLHSQRAPLGPLGLVVWIDNQYAAFRPDGRLRNGMLPNESPAWIEVRNLTVERIPGERNE